MEDGEKKKSMRHFFADQKIAISCKNCVLEHPIAHVLDYGPDTF